MTEYSTNLMIELFILFFLQTGATGKEAEAEAEATASANMTTTATIALMNRAATTARGSGAVLTAWLWHMHNRINVRLGEEEAAEPAMRFDSENPKILWPPPHQCPRCRRAHTAGVFEWDIEAILSHLHSVFAPPPSTEEDLRLKVVGFAVGEVANRGSDDGLSLSGSWALVLPGIVFAVALVLLLLKLRTRRGSVVNQHHRRRPPP